MTAREVLGYIDHLPPYSAFADAMAQDDELAEMYASVESGPTKPRITEWTPERAELAKVNDKLAELIAVVIQAAGGKGSRPQPEPRPETALDRLKARVEEQAFQSLLDKIEAARSGVAG